MPKLIVPPLDKVVTKWVEEAPKRSGYYEAEAPAAADTWYSEAIAAAGVYKSAVTAPNIEKLYSGGIKRVGAAKFRRKVVDVGVDRYGPGITAAKDDYSTGVEPFLALLATITIKERGPRGSAGNYEIVKQVGDPLHKKRLAIRAAMGT